MRVNDLIPDYLLERSLKFKTAVIVVGAVLLLLSSLLRSAYPVIWILPFLVGALIEWFVVATVYVEMSELEKDITRARSEIQSALDEIESIQADVNQTQAEINQTRENVFSFMSGSQGGASDSIEDRLSELEDEVGTGAFSHGSLSDRISALERRVQQIERDSRF